MSNHKYDKEVQRWISEDAVRSSKSLCWAEEDEEKLEHDFMKVGAKFTICAIIGCAFLYGAVNAPYVIGFIAELMGLN